MLVMHLVTFVFCISMLVMHLVTFVFCISMLVMHLVTFVFCISMLVMHLVTFVFCISMLVMHLVTLWCVFRGSLSPDSRMMCVSLFLHLAMYLLFYCQPFFATHAALSPFLIGRTFVREHSWEYWANILVK